MASAVIGVPFSTSRLPKHLKYTGWPWCWIRTIAPGILPEAISSLRKSSMGESFLRDSTASGGGPSSPVAADKGAANETAATIAANRMAKGRVDVTLRGNICLPDRSVGRSDVIALLQSDPDGRGRNARRCYSDVGFCNARRDHSKRRNGSVLATDQQSSRGGR